MTDIVERLRNDLEEIQDYDRPLPWVVHNGCSFRRIASKPTRENPRSFPDGNVLQAVKQRSDGHLDLSMGEKQLEALVRLINGLPEAADIIEAQRAKYEELIFEVASKHSDESRHETALRYIRERERTTHEEAQEATP